ncbi:serine protease 30 isoform X3 [Eurytemora carolleeae]|uniref:serine protease 30 isoform X3 n=1 Tax=Eurytemora carolleeae TaxID=1294199 RepID=UPI000C76ABAD|nr:serine protease 30 isoform X3 [Eurytemora carolleeae]|eukprot:XP_023335380.1 serine protease 30-like isoform X3 [Eurytemora affinis]
MYLLRCLHLNICFLYIFSLLNSTVDGHVICFPGEPCNASEVSTDESSEEPSPSLEEEEELVQILPDPEEEDDGIELEETPDLEENLGISVRSSYQVGWSCFATIGHFGTCRTPSSCRGLSYSYSSSCGYRLICCKDRRQVQSSVSSGSSGSIGLRRPVTQPSIPVPVSRPVPVSKPVPVTERREAYPGCGTVPTNFIIGGKEATQGQFPFMVAFLQWRFAEKNYHNFCGGVLITKRHVLTAAHCVDKATADDFKRQITTVKIGLVNLLDRPIVTPNIQKAVIHPEYSRTGPGLGNPVNDIAIVTLDRDVTVSQGAKSITPVCLPTTTRGVEATIAGWGYTERVRGETVKKLRFADVEEFSQPECSRKYNQNVKNIRVDITDKFICAGNQTTDSCNGDSGGPLLWSENYRWTVGGIASFGPSACGSVIPGVYTKVESHLDWIYSSVDGYL